MPKKILIADDNAQIRFLIRNLVESAGFTVAAEATNGTEAIEHASKFHPDLILLDLSMPLLNGAEAASILKKQVPKTPIILFTLHEDSVGTALAKQIGVDRVIGKPDGMTKLVDSIRELLALPPDAVPSVGPLKVPTESKPSGVRPQPTIPSGEKPPE